MRATALLAVVALGALWGCSSSPGRAASSSGAPASSGTSTTVPASTIAQSDVDAVEVQGAKAFATLYADTLRKSDPSITQAEVDCLPDSLVGSVGAHHLLALANQPYDQLSPADLAAVTAGFTACGISADKVTQLFQTSS